MVDIQGTVQDGFGKVADAFAKNFEDFPELGANFALYADGVLQVDLHAGIADQASGRAWTDDTLQLVFSTTKGAAAVCVARLVAAGKLDYDAPVASYWPEFAANGKDAITLGQMMSHQAGLPYVEPPLTLDDLVAVTPVVEALAEQAPLWEPGSAHGYHALTYGWLAGEVVRRADGRSIGTYLAEEMAGPLGLDFWIGLPEEHEHRVSTLETAPPPTDPAELALMMQVMGPGTVGFHALTMSGAILAFGGPNPFNTRAVHGTEMPAANGIGNARSLARLYAATVGEVDGVRLLDDATREIAAEERVFGADKALVAETRFGAGFMLPCDLVPMLTPYSYGHAGAGGSLAYADPAEGVGYAYVMNQMLGGIAGDPRTITLNDAVRACL